MLGNCCPMDPNPLLFNHICGGVGSPLPLPTPWWGGALCQPVEGSSAKGDGSEWLTVRDVGNILAKQRARSQGPLDLAEPRSPGLSLVLSSCFLVCVSLSLWVFLPCDCISFFLPVYLFSAPPLSSASPS